MNLLQQIPLTKTGDDLRIQFSEIEAGWMNITIVSGTDTYSYTASYINDTPPDLVETAIQLLQDSGGIENVVLYHDLEGSMVTWYFARTANKLVFFVWEEMYPDRFSEMIGCKFESECLEDLGETTDLNKGLRLASETTPLQFAQTIVAAFTELDKAYTLEEYKKNWRNTYPEAQLKQLRQMLKG